MTPHFGRGSVVTVRFDPGIGSEIRKTRPAIVVSNDIASAHDAVVQVVPITSMPDRHLRPYEARIASGDSGLRQPSRAVANQIRTISRKRIGKVIGQIAAEERIELDNALRIQLALVP